MGKYMRKAKTDGEVAVMDVAVSQSSLGVRTRARTLALQRLQQKSPPAATSDGSYLQLRSRRLEKPPVGVNDSSRRTKQVHGDAKEKDGCAQNSNGNSRERVKVAPEDSGPSVSGPKENSGNDKEKEIVEEKNDNDLGVEASFGENVLECEVRERESTPCSLIRDPETIRTPSSSNRPNSTTEKRSTQSSPNSHIPTAHEVNQFFADAEEEQRRQFIEKYNYDPKNDKPLPGNFEWKKIDQS